MSSAVFDAANVSRNVCSANAANAAASAKVAARSVVMKSGGAVWVRREFQALLVDPENDGPL